MGTNGRCSTCKWEKLLQVQVGRVVCASGGSCGQVKALLGVREGCASGHIGGTGNGSLGDGSRQLSEGREKGWGGAVG